MNNRNSILDISKFLMSIYIALGHYVYIIGQEYSGMTKPWLPTRIIAMKYIVDIFFVISGYLAVNTYRGDSTYLYIKSKVQRLYPMMIISLIEFSIFGLLFRMVYGHFWAGRNIQLSELIINLFGLNMWVGTGVEINGPIWYVSVLMFCYLIFAILQNDHIDKKIAYPLISVIGLCAVLYKNGIMFLSENMGRGGYSFFWGCTLALLLKNKNKIKSYVLILGSVLLIVFLTCSYLVKENLLGNYHIIFTMIISSMLVYFSQKITVRNQKIGTILKELGGISYPIYLLQIPTYVLVCLLFSNRIDYKTNSVMIACLLGVIINSVLAQWAYKELRKHLAT